MKNKIPILRKKPIPRGRSIKLNLKICDLAAHAFRGIKELSNSKTNSQVFNYIYNLAESFPEKNIKDKFTQISEDAEHIRHWRTFTINEYTLAWLNKLAKKKGLQSVDDLIESTLLLFRETLTEAQRKFKKDAKKYANKEFCLKAIENIWTQVSELRYGLDYAFNLEYDNSDPENYNTWFANIEGGLQELEDLVPKLFEQEAAKKS